MEMKVQGIVVSSFGNVYTIQTLSNKHIFLNTENPIERQILEESLKGNLIVCVEDGKLDINHADLNNFIQATQFSEEGEGANEN